MNFLEKMAAWQQHLNSQLQLILPNASHPLHQSMRYAVLNGGKRFRPILLYSCAETLNIAPEILDNAACAIELIHCYSLIHDDLPAMDNDDFRRGKPTCHKAFNEGIAILAGDALQTLAFERLATPHPKLHPPQQLKMISNLSKAIGANGMAFGQALDITAHSTISAIELETLQVHKTGKFIKACIELALIAADCQDPTIQEHLIIFGDCLGLAFQLRDDILDIEGKFDLLGKQPGSDLVLDKATFPSIIGLDATKKTLQALYQTGLNALEHIDLQNSLLASIAKFTVAREL